MADTATIGMCAGCLDPDRRKLLLYVKDCGYRCEECVRKLLADAQVSGERKHG